jgi:magnesium chelatase subunit I
MNQMEKPPNSQFESPFQDETIQSQQSVPVRSLRELLDQVTGKGFEPATAKVDSGLAEVIPFPFLALVGQREMKIALILALINPNVGGVLLIGPRGTGKTTAIRGLLDLLPEAPRSLCYYGCLPEDIETGGIDAVCPGCAKKWAEGEPLAVMEKINLIELPLNARLEDVVGGIDERAVSNQRLRLKRGILSHADRNLLFVDEVNLLENEVIDALLEAAAQGYYLVRRGPLTATYRSRFILIGSMNPEEGQLRPQIQDRFGLRVIVTGLKDPKERLEAYHRVQIYQNNPRQAVTQYLAETTTARIEIQAAKSLLHEVKIPDDVAGLGLKIIQRLGIDSLRAEITLFEAARAYAAADGRQIVCREDICEIIPMALRLRRSQFISDYLNKQDEEDSEFTQLLDEMLERPKFHD